MQDEKVEQWAQAAATGDRTALHSLYDLLSLNLYGYLADTTRDSQLAEDLLQQLWVRVMEKIKTRRGPVRPWVFTVTRNLALDALRAKQRSKKIELNDGPDLSVGPERIAENREEAERLRNAIQELPADLRDVVLLRFYSGLAFREIAGILSCPLGTAATRLRTALAQLQRKLHCERQT